MGVGITAAGVEGPLKLVVDPTMEEPPAPLSTDSLRLFETFLNERHGTVIGRKIRTISILAFIVFTFNVSYIYCELLRNVLIKKPDRKC